MKTLSLLLLTVMIGLQANAQKKIKIITYNVLEGLGNEASYGKGRHDLCVQWLKEQNADVIAFQELYGSEETFSEDAKEWGHNYYVKAGNIGLSSKEPIVWKKIYARKDLRNNVLQCKTFGINFFVVHLSPADWKYRLREAGIIEGIIDSVKQATNKYILLGDLNAHSPFDSELYRQNPELIEKYEKGDYMNESKGIPDRNLADYTLDYSVMSKFLSFPLIDVTERFVPWHNRHSFPSPILIGVWRTAGNIGRTPERIDYILTSPEISKNCKEVIIHNGEANDYISDHYPIEAIFEISD